MELIALLPKDRTKLGMLEVRDGAKLIETFQVYAKADNAMAAKHGNAKRNPIKPFGDTPLGTWNARLGKAFTSVEDIRTYGPNPVLTLWPTGGQALISHEPKNRRTGIWLHGGDLNASGALRPTYGCLRVHDSTMARLHELSKQHGPITTLETKEL